MEEAIRIADWINSGGITALMCLILAVFGILAYKLYPDIKEYISERTQAAKATAEREAERNEIIRNCNATIEACTEALKMIGNDRKIIVEQINTHEQLSRERIDHIQTVVNQCRDEIGKARGDIGVVMDRTAKL